MLCVCTGDPNPAGIGLSARGGDGGGDDVMSLSRRETYTYNNINNNKWQIRVMRPHRKTHDVLYKNDVFYSITLF